MQEWPTWNPTAERIHAPRRAEIGRRRPRQSAGFARAVSLSGDKDTLFRIHGTNQPEYIGASISSGCIRMTNEDVIDLYNRAKLGTVVVVLDPKHGDSPFNSKMALQGGGTRRRSNCANLCIRSKAPVSPALFFCGLLWRAGSASGSAARTSLAAPASLGFAASDLAATSRGGASSGRSAGNSGADLRQRIPHVPLADPVVVAPLHQVEMDVILVVPVRPRTQHRGESRADGMQHTSRGASRATPRSVSEIERPLASLSERTSSALARPCSDSCAPTTRLRPRHSNESKLSSSLIVGAEALPPAAPCRCGSSRRWRSPWCSGGSQRASPEPAACPAARSPPAAPGPRRRSRRGP